MAGRKICLGPKGVTCSLLQRMPLAYCSGYGNKVEQMEKKVRRRLLGTLPRRRLMDSDGIRLVLDE